MCVIVTIKDLKELLAQHPDDMQVGVRCFEPTYGHHEPYSANDLDIRGIETITKKLAWWQRSTDTLVIVSDHYGVRPK